MPTTKHVSRKVLFFGREGCSRSEDAVSFLNQNGFETTCLFSSARNEDLSRRVAQWHGDYIFCFRSLYILDASEIARARIAAINFHPGPTERRGTGCLNFALYHNDKVYGVTSHLMAAEIDAGPILGCWRFPINANDTVDTLLLRTQDRLLTAFREFITALAAIGDGYIDVARDKFKGERWSGPLSTKQDLDRLSQLDDRCTREEMNRVIRATHTAQFPTTLTWHGHVFSLMDNN